MMNVIGEPDIGYQEYDPDISNPLFVLASCPAEARPEGTPRLWGNLRIRIAHASMAYRIYQQEEIEEPYSCNFELNLEYKGILEKRGVKISGTTASGSASVIELPNHAFYIATSYQPQLSSEENNPHPLIVAFLEAAINYQKEKKK